MNDRVTDMRRFAVTSNEALYYARHDVLEKQIGSLGTIIRRPLEWFLTDLAKLAETKHPDLLLCWIRDALLASDKAAEIHLFTGAGDWSGLDTHVRVHLIGKHGYKYLSFGFVDTPQPRWSVIGARHVQVCNYDRPGKRDDTNYARDATRAW